jgi:hypothetical protein
MTPHSEAEYMTATGSSLIGLQKQSCARERSIYVCGELLIFRANQQFATHTINSRHRGHKPYSQIQRRRSPAKSRARPPRWRRKTASWWRNAMTSSSRAARPRQRPASQEYNSEIDASIRRDYGSPSKIARLVNPFRSFLVSTVSSTVKDLFDQRPAILF